MSVLGALAHARSGDKGGNSNIGIWVPDPAALGTAPTTLTTERIRSLLPETKGLEIVRHETPDLRAVHLVLRGLLGTGGSSNLRVRPGRQVRGRVHPGQSRARPQGFAGPRERTVTEHAVVSATDRIAASIAQPATDDAFDPHAELADLLGGVGLSAADAGGTVTFDGADPVVPSTLRLGGAAGIALVAKSVAMAKLWRSRGGAGQDIAVDLRVAPHRLCPFYDRKWELLNGYPPVSGANPSPAFGFAFYRTADERWVMPLNPYPKIKIAAQKLLDVPDDEPRVAAAIVRWNARDLEAAGAEAGVVLPMLRSTEELLAEPHYREVLADLPLVEITRIGDSVPMPLPPGVADPLTGVRALGMGHVIAGAGTGRALALHGADVLNLWRPGELEHKNTYATANVGVRSATLDPYSADGRARIAALLADADVFFANRRPGYLEHDRPVRRAGRRAAAGHHPREHHAQRAEPGRGRTGSASTRQQEAWSA